MKKIIFSFALILASVMISFAQSNNTTAIDENVLTVESKEVEFYTSLEEFEEANPEFFVQAIIMTILDEVSILNTETAVVADKKNIAAK